MDKHKICKICDKSFANGKAMGGHMRSHFAKLPIPPKPNNNPSPPPKRSYRSLNQEFFDLENGSIAESSRNMKAKTISKRPSKAIAPPKQPESGSSVAGSSAPPPPESVSLVPQNLYLDKQGAMSLLMLSRDKWPLSKDKQVVVEEEVNEYVKDGNEDESCLVTGTNNKFNYKCDTCKKLFGSYQSLGGHKASHKKIKVDAAGDEDVVTMNQRIFQCPFCDKVFNSGQALGGHKKVHFAYLPVPSPKASGKDTDERIIDLNLPSLESGIEVSQV